MGGCREEGDRVISEVHSKKIITEWLSLEGASGGHLLEPPAQAGPPRVSCPVPCLDNLNVFEEGDSAASLGNLFWYSVTLTVKSVS